MPCQELDSCISQTARAQGNGLASASPRADGFCRAYDFTQAEQQGIVTIVDLIQITTISGDPLYTII